MFAVALDWHSRDTYTYLAVAGALVIALSLGLYAIPGSRLKVPGIALSIVGGLGAGLALGILLMGAMGYEFKKSETANENAAPQPMPPGPLPIAGAGGGGRGGPGGPGGGGGRGPSPKARLALLVGKLDVLTEKPLTVQLSDEQRKQVQEQLAGLADAEELSDDAAREKLDKLQAVLEGQKDTLEAVGYAWPREGGGGPGRGGPGGGPPMGGRGGQQPPNPFTAGQNAEHLKRLTERLDKK